MMDLSDTVVTTRKIVATLSADEIRTSSIAFVRGQVGLSADAVCQGSATTAPDGTVRVELTVTMPAAPEAPAVPDEPAAPVLPPAVAFDLARIVPPPLAITG